MDSGSLQLGIGFASTEAFLRAFDAEIAKGGLLVRGAVVQGAPALAACALEVAVAGQAPLRVDAKLAAVVPGVGVAVVFPDGAPALAELAATLRGSTPASSEWPASGAAPTPTPSPAAGGKAPVLPGAQTVAQRLKALSVPEKMQVALTADRDTRAALMRDLNKSIHLYVLRNPRIGLDEVQFAAKMATFSVDALVFISEHKEWGVSPGVCAALARNPSTPMPLAIKLLSRVPMQDLKAIAKGAARQPIVQAARRILAG